MNTQKLYTLIIPIAVLAILILMVIPLPTQFLDVLIATNISFALLVLFVTIYIKSPLEISAFPSILLIATLFRLGINVATTRSILLRADAGSIIEAFGDFVVGGNYVVGFAIFLILIIIQFIVITKGATRVAEVAARFTLDAMPGKQMAIDADLNAGIIDEMEAKERRKEIRREADFYGAMDGASKFVRGDAIAGIIIVIINIIVGFVVGVVQKNMGWSQALTTYTLLTVGDGLVSQIPALIISTGAGMVVTRAASEEDFGTEFTHQLTNQPKALIITSGALGIFAFFGLITGGLPKLPFFILSGLLGYLAYNINQKMKEEAEEEMEAKEEEEEHVPTPEEEREQISDMMQVDTLEFEIGYGLIYLVDKEKDGGLLDRISHIRKQIALDLGIIIPSVRIRDNMQLKPNEYLIKIKNVERGRGELMPEYFLAMNPGDVKEEIEGISVTEPVFGLPAYWITEENKEQAEMYGYTVVEPPAIIATHLTEIIKDNAAEILTRQDVNELLENVKKTNQVVVDELIPNKLSIGNLQKILQNLLDEGISIRDMNTILETIADYVDSVKDTDILTEYVRLALSKQFIYDYTDDKNNLYVLSLDPELEQKIVDSIEETSYGVNISLNPSVYEKILKKIKEIVEKKGITPNFLVSPNVRPYFKKLIEKQYPESNVFSYNEVDNKVSVKVVDMVGV